MKPQILLLLLAVSGVSVDAQENLMAGRNIQKVAKIVGIANRAGRFQRAMFGPGGEILALDPSRGNVAIFSSEGVYRTDFGSYGRDLGQFESAITMGWQGDSIWVFDLSRNRISFADASFQIRRAEPLPYFKWPIETFLTLRGITPSRELWLEEGASPNGFGRMSANGRVITMLRRDTIKLDTAANLPFQDAVFLLRFPNNGLLMKAQPWAPAPLFAVSPNGLHAAVARQALGSDTIVLQRWNVGTHRWVEHNVVLKSNRLPVAAVNAAIAKFLTSDLISRFPNKEAATRAVREALFVPDYYPQFSRLLVASDGSVWLLHPDSHKDQSWVVISTDQNDIETVVIPENIPLEDVNARTHLAIGIQESAGDETAVVILKLASN